MTTTRTGNLDNGRDALHIRDVSGEFGLTMRALRFYEEKGLIKPKRKVGRHRHYAEKDIERLRVIVTLKSLGLSLSEVRTVLASPGKGPYGLTAKLCADITVRLSTQKAEVEAALAEVQKIARAFPPKASGAALACLDVVDN